MAEASWFFTIPTLVDEKGARRPGARRLLRMLGSSACVISLDSRRSAAAEARHLQEVGLEVVESQIYSSAMAGVDYVRHIAPEKKHAACLGSRALRETMMQGGLELSGRADWLFVGQTRQAAYEDYDEAFRILREGAAGIAVDGGLTVSSREGESLGCGAIVRMLESAAGCRMTHMDSFSPLFLSQAARYVSASYGDCVLVSGYLEGELSEAAGAGWKTVLVSSLMDENENLLTSSVHPDWIVENLSDFASSL